MPSERRRPKDDTWTSEELNKALKGPKDDMHRRKKREDDGDRRRHRDDVNGSDRRRDDDRKSHRREEDDKKSRRHRDRGDSPDAGLTEEDRERLRQERRAKREGGKEEKKSRPKESKPSKTVEDDRKRSQRDRDDDHRGDRKHRDERDGERRHHDKDKDRRRHDDDGRRRHDEDDRKKRHKEESSSRRHHDDNDKHKRHEGSSDRRKRREEESSGHRRREEEDDEEERERRRQERREKREREQGKDKGHDREKERSSHRRSEKSTEEDQSSRRRNERSNRDHVDSGREHEESRHHRNRDDDRDKGRQRERDSERSDRHREESPKVSASSSNGRHKKEEKMNENEEDDYDYEDDFEDYEDDFEDDDEDPEMKEHRRGTKKKEGEMEEVLRALDEENNRLVSASRRSNWSDSTELSDERFKDNRDDDEPVPRAAPRAKTFINFVSAKQRVMDQTLAGKARKRFEDLTKLIELDVAKYDMFDLPPVKEYELYIRNFGRSDTKQAYIQTGEDDIEREVQTEEIESLSKWTQHPPDEDTAVGGEGITVQAPDDTLQTARKTDPAKLDSFLERVGQFLFTVLDEESKSSNEEERIRDSRPTASFSEKASQLGMPNFLKGRHVLALSFCQSEPNSLLSVHSSPLDDSQGAKDLSTIRASSPVEGEKQSVFQALSVICIWNLSSPAYPYRICGSEMRITCACFSPTKASLVFGGMHDGSVALWDLREPGSQHRSIEMDGQDHLVRFPTYNTAGVIESENHQSPVTAIVPVYSNIVGSLKDENAAESSSGLSFQLASVEEKAVVNLWVVGETGVPDPAGSENDLGLAPGGRMKIMRSSSIVLNNPNRYLSTSNELKALDLHLNPGDLNHFYVGTDAGCVVHGVRFGKRAYPQSHSSLVDSPVPVVSLDFSPFGQPYFLAGCKDGTLHLFHNKMENPISTWREFVTGESILCVRWSQSRPAVFFVLDNNSTVFTFDLVENGLGPIKMDRITAADATLLEVGGDSNLLNPGISRPAYMVLALDNGSTEVLTISNQMREQQPLEEDFLASYIDRY